MGTLVLCVSGSTSCVGLRSVFLFPSISCGSHTLPGYFLLRDPDAVYGMILAIEKD